MFLKHDKRNGKIRFREFKSIKLGEGKYKDEYQQTIGTVPAALTFGSELGISFIKKIYKAGQEVTKNRLPDIIKSLTSNEFAEIMNRILEKVDTTNYHLGEGVLNVALDYFDLGKLFKKLEKETGRGYVLFDYYKYVLFHQILAPDSMLNYYQTQDIYSHFYGPEEYKEQDLYDFLTFFYEHRLEFQKVMFEATLRLLGPQKLYIVYYDGSNIYTFATHADPDKLDEFGKVVQKGLRKYGYGKDGKNLPLVSIGILSSETGVPLFYSVFPGNEQEVTNILTDIRNLRKALLEDDTPSRFLLCADAGNYSGDVIWRISGDNRQALLPENKAGDEYLLGKGFLKADKQTRDWACDPEGYYALSKGKKHRLQKKKEKITFVKARVVEANLRVQLENGKIKIVKAPQLQVALISTRRKYKKMKDIDEQLVKAVEISNNPKKFKNVYKKMSSKYLSPYGVMPDTGEITNDVRSIIDEEALQKDIESAGIFIITSSQTNLAPGKVISIYRNKNISEQIFHYMKGIFDVQPIYFRTKEHIIAHIDICVQSVILVNVMRLIIQKKTGICFSVESIQKQLDRLAACPIGLNTYRITGIQKKLKSILSAFDIKLDKAVYTQDQLKKIFHF